MVRRIIYLAATLLLCASTAWGRMGMMVVGGTPASSTKTWVEKFSDTFTGTENTALSTYDSTWVTGSSPVQRASINASNQLKITANFARYNISTAGFSGDQAAEADLHYGSDYVGVCINYTTTGTIDDEFTGYCAFHRNNIVYIYERADTTWGSSVTGDTVTFSAGETLRIQRIGSTVKAFVNGTERATMTDSSYTGGQPAIRAAGPADPFIDNFKAYNYE